MAISEEALLQVLEEVMESEETLGLLAPERLRDRSRGTTLAVQAHCDLAASREEIKALKQRVDELSNEVSSVYGAYDRTMSELRRCREGARDQYVTVILPRELNSKIQIWL